MADEGDHIRKRLVKKKKKFTTFTFSLESQSASKYQRSHCLVVSNDKETFTFYVMHLFHLLERRLAYQMVLTRLLMSLFVRVYIQCVSGVHYDKQVKPSWLLSIDMK